MYQVEAGSALRNAIRAVGLRCGAGRISRNVLALGLTSLLTDISSEMVATVLPVYLVLHLGLTPLHFGVVDGLYNVHSHLPHPQVLIAANHHSPAPVPSP